MVTALDWTNSTNYLQHTRYNGSGPIHHITQPRHSNLIYLCFSSTAMRNKNYEVSSNWSVWMCKLSGNKLTSNFHSNRTQAFIWLVCVWPEYLTYSARDCMSKSLCKYPPQKYLKITEIDELLKMLCSVCVKLVTKKKFPWHIHFFNERESKFRRFRR